MPFPQREYVTLRSVAQSWKAPIADVRHYAETGKLRCAIWINETCIELGSFERLANGQKHFCPDCTVYVEGLVGLLPEDCRLLFRNKCASCSIFVSLKTDGLFLQIADEAKRTVSIKPCEVVVRMADKIKFERQHALAGGFAESTTSYTDAPAFVPSTDKSRFSFSNDFKMVTLDGTVFHFGGMQAKVVELLYQASQTDSTWVYGKILLYEADSRSDCLKSLFKRQKQWRKLIESDGKGHYRLMF
jgi:hypothetical protein